MSDIRLDIVIQGRWVRGLTVPGDDTPRQLVSAVLRHLNIQPTAGSGEAISYSVLHVGRDFVLPEDATLAESGIRDGDTLRLVSPYITVYVQLLDLSRTEIESFPLDVSVSSVINSLVAKYRLPSRDEKFKEGKIYELFSKTAGQCLHAGMTLAEARIPNLDTFFFCTKEIPGGPELPTVPKLSKARKAGKTFSAWLRRVVARLRQSRLPAGTRLDPVDCTAFAPPTVRRGGSRLIQVHIHRPGAKAYVKEVARELDEEATRRSFKRLEMDIARGSNISFHLTMRGVKVSDPMQTILWKGHPNMVFFGIDIPNSHPLGDVIGTVRISCDRIPVGHIKFKMTVVDKDGYPELVPADSAFKYEMAFASYAWEDRPEVLKRVQILRVLGIKTFQDVLSLRPGARWEQQLYKHIEESDLFLLFWSSAASRSEWVSKEIGYALKVKGGDDLAPPEIVPVPVEGPPAVPPPEELAHLHFNDYLLYLMAAPEAGSRLTEKETGGI